MFYVQLASLGGCFWPSEVRFRGILALSRDWFYNGKKTKCKFLKKGSLSDFKIFCGDSWDIFTKNGTNLSTGQFFFGFDPFRPLCIDSQFSHFGYQYCTLGPRLEHIAVLFRKYWTESTYWLTVIAFWLPILHCKIGYNIAIILISHRNEKNAIAQGCFKHIYK